MGSEASKGGGLHQFCHSAGDGNHQELCRAAGMSGHSQEPPSLSVGVPCSLPSVLGGEAPQHTAHLAWRVEESTGGIRAREEQEL